MLSRRLCYYMLRHVISRKKTKRKLYRVHCYVRLIIEHIDKRELKGQTIEPKYYRHQIEIPGSRKNWVDSLIVGRLRYKILTPHMSIWDLCKNIWFQLSIYIYPSKEQNYCNFNIIVGMKTSDSRKRKVESNNFFHKTKNIGAYFISFDVQEQAMTNAMSAIHEKVRTVAGFYILFFKKVQTRTI